MLIWNQLFAILTSVISKHRISGGGGLTNQCSFCGNYTPLFWKGAPRKIKHFLNSFCKPNLKEPEDLNSLLFGCFGQFIFMIFKLFSTVHDLLNSRKRFLLTKKATYFLLAFQIHWLLCPNWSASEYWVRWQWKLGFQHFWPPPRSLFFMGDVLPLLSYKIVIKRLGVCVLRENILSDSIIGIYLKIAALLIKSLIFFAMSRLILKKTTFANILYHPYVFAVNI